MNKTVVIDAREILGTSGRYIRKLLDNLQTLDKVTNYHILLHKEALDQVSLAASNFHKLLVKPRKFTLAEQLRLGGDIKELKPDLVHFTMPNQPVFYRGNVVTTVHDLTAVKFINSDQRPNLYRVKKFLYAWVIKKAARKSKIIITPTDYVKNDLREYTGINAEKIIVTPESADKITDVPEPIAALSGKSFIFYTGRAHPHKNLTRLVEAFEKLQATQPDLLLVFGGKQQDNYETIEKQVKSGAMGDKVVFTDFVSEGQLRWLYENALAYVFPSLSEGFGLPGLEAMVHGCPVVSSNSTCLPEVYGDAAVYFDPLDVDDMAHKISQVSGDEKLQEELSKRGKQQAAKYSWKLMAEQTLAVYEKVLSK